MGYYDTPGYACGIALSDSGFIYVADYTNMGIYRFTDPFKVDDSFIPHPSSFILYSAYPNPFNSTTTIRYGLPYPSHVSLQIYNLSGQRIGTLFEGYRQAGFHIANLNAGDLASGFYMIRLETPEQAFSRRVVLVK